MENNFFVGVVVHRRRKSNSLTREKLVLYSRNDIDYIDLLNNNRYVSEESANTREDYVIKSSLIKVDVSDYRTDYYYLLSRYNEYKEEGRNDKRSLFLRIKNKVR